MTSLAEGGDYGAIFYLRIGYAFATGSGKAISISIAS